MSVISRCCERHTEKVRDLRQLHPRDGHRDHRSGGLGFSSARRQVGELGHGAPAAQEQVRPRAPAADRGNHPVPAEARGRQALLPGPLQIRRPQPAGRGRRFEFIALVEAPGIENERGRKACTVSRGGGTIRHEGGPGSVSSRASKCADGGGVGTESSRPAGPGYELRHVVEPALARALVLAAEAQRWDVVVQIATELRERREARDGVRRAGDCISVSAMATRTTVA